MGIESYFFHLVPEGVRPIRVDENELKSNSFGGESQIQVADLFTKLDDALSGQIFQYRSVPTKYELIIDGNIELVLNHAGGLFQEAAVTGCMGWYEEGVVLSYQIAATINRFVRVRAYVGTDESISLETSQTEFCAFIFQTFEKQRTAYLETFGAFKIRACAGKDFYSKYRLSKSLWGRVILRSYAIFRT